MQVWSFYDRETGHFSNSCYQGAEAYLEQNTPAGFIAIAGEFDRHSERIDPATGEVVPWQPPKPADTPHTCFEWDETARRWVGVPTALCLEHKGLAAIDAAAGAARLRFITDVPGQQAVYLMKLEEARAVLADPGATAPHIHGEAAATGRTPAEVAAAVIGMAELWNAVLSPAIEAARIGGKAAVSAAAQDGDAAAITAAAEAAIAQLDAIAPPA